MLDSMLEFVDLGDAKRETRQMFPAEVYMDNMYVWGIFPNRI